MIAYTVWGWFKHLAGTDNGSGLWYLWWSGFVGDITIFAAVVLFLRHRNCHVKGCWRLGHPDPKHGHPTCKTHSPHFDTHGRLRPPVVEMTSTEWKNELARKPANPSN
jgi:hypothetical protein